MDAYHSSCGSIMPQQVEQVFVQGDVLYNVYVGADVVLALTVTLNVVVVVLIAIFRKRLKRFFKWKLFKKLLS